MTEGLQQPHFGQWLRQARLTHGLTQSELAGQMVIAPKTIQRWEQGEQLPRPYLLPKLIAVLGPLPEQSAPDAPLSENVSLGAWNVPYRRNPHFTGRDELLDQLAQQLSPETQDIPTRTRRAALTQPQAIKGLGGIGKTQIAVEYAYRSRDLGLYTHTFWVNAASEETLLTSFVTLAELLPAFPAKSETDQRKQMEAMKRGLEQCHQDWLLIFDNADDVALVRDYLPKQGLGSVLLTTRAYAVGSLAISVEVETMGFIEGTHLLLRRAQRFDQTSDEEINQAGNIVVALDHFPLALDQAGAYIEETQCSFVDYLNIYQNHRKVLLAQRGMQSTNYPDSVATTWSLSFQKVQQSSPAAVELLQLCAFLAPDRIPEELIKNGAAHWSVPLQAAVMDDLAFNHTIAELLKFSLVRRNAEAHILSIHRIVQVVLKDTLQQDVQRCWAERVIRMINDVVPFKVKGERAYQQCSHYLDHVQVCGRMIEDYMLTGITDVDLLNQASLFLGTRARLYVEAESFSLRALAICEQKVATPYPEMATTLNNLACVYKEQRHYWAKAEPLFKRALVIREQLGDEYPETATTLNDLANLYREQGRFIEAEPLFKRALVIFEQQLEQVGLDSVPIGVCLHNAALVYDKLGYYAEAETCFQRELEINERWYGSEHSATIPCLMRLVEWYQKQQFYSENIQLSVRILAFFEKEIGAEDDITRAWMSHLANLYEKQGCYTEAEPLYQRVLITCEQMLGPEHPDTLSSLNDLIYLYYNQGRYEQAEALCQRLLTIHEQQFGLEHFETAASLNTLALLYDNQGKYIEAEPLYQRLLQMREQELGATHPDTATSLNNLAVCLRKQGRYDQAEVLQRRSLAIAEQQLGPKYLDTALNLDNLALLYQKQGRYVEAEPLHWRALAITEQELGPEHPEVAYPLNNLAILYQELEKYAEAEPLFQRALAIREQHLGEVHPLTRTLYKNYAALLRIIRREEEAKQLEKRI